MNKTANAENRRSLTTVFVILGLIASFAFLPSLLFRSSAGNDDNSNRQSENSVKALEDYDIRTDKTQIETLLSFRQTAGRSAVENADIRDKFVASENQLRRSVPTLKIEYNKELQNPEVIAPDVLQGRAFLTEPSNIKHSTVLSNFAKANNNLLALTDEQIDRLKVAADYTNPNGELSFVRLEQTINGVPVYRAEIRAGFNKQGAMFRAVNNLAPGLDYSRVSTDFGNPENAVRKAAGYLNYSLKESDTTRNETDSNDLKTVFGQGDWATTAEKIYFPTEIGVARAAWRVLIWDARAYYVIVDAETGTMLSRENITYDQTQQASFNVYANTTNMLKVMPNPAPLATNPISPALGTQGVIQPRTSITLIGNEAPYTFNNLGWITDNANSGNGYTDGNNVEAGVDRDNTNGVDAVVQGTNRVFNFAYTPGAGIGTDGDSPLLPAYQNGAATNLFYVTNRFHDETYLLGFTEQARNFQNDNFGRGGSGNDRVSAEAQDDTVGASCSARPCVNNANFSTPSDGGRGRMQMYLWNRMSPNRDGDLDAEIIVHELTHGLFGRLHNGVGGTQAGQMNEGNSDFFAHVLLSNVDDPINGISVTGGYTTYLLRGTTFNSNYYYGIRRFPKAVMAFTGGANNRPHNPLTFADIDPAQMNLTDGAFAPAFTGSATAVHDGGEIWSSMLWEVRARLVQRLGAVAGNKKVLQLVMDGMKVSPANPTMIQERNAIVSAAFANGNSADVGDIWAGFAVRGMGASATNPTGNTVVQAFDTPNVVQTPTFSFSDAAPGGDGDGVAEPGEALALSVPLTNNSGATITSVTLQIAGNSANYGDIANGLTVTRNVSYTVPAATACGSNLALTFNVNGSAGASVFTRTISIGSPIVGSIQNFDSVTAPAFPSGWSSTQISGTSANWVTSTTTPNSAPIAAFANDPAVATETALEMPAVAITSATSRMKFKINYDTEAGWDGTTLNIKIGSGAYQDIIAAGGSFITGAYSASLATGTFPQAGRQAWTGDSNGYVDVEVTIPAAANGQNVQFRWNASSDTAVGGAGTFIDDIQIINNFVCSVPTSTTVKARGDFDGDGKTDFSVFRPSEGNWYLNRSTAGFTALGWGNATDKLVPGDFDGDRKTDVAVYRDGTWFINKSSGGNQYASFGAPTDKTVVGDYDGDGKDDVAVFRPSNGTWYIQNSGGGITSAQFGADGDVPVSGDYDGDGKTNLAIFRPSSATWYIARATGVPSQNFDAIQFGASDDKLVPADYDGDGKTDLAVYRPSNGIWYIRRSQAGFTGVQFGALTDVPVPGDYDGDGKADVAVYRGGTWFVNRSTTGFTSAVFGVNSDLPIPRYYIP